MPEATVASPGGAYAGSADFTAYTDRTGNLIQYGQDIKVFRANEAITQWAAVALVAATATVPTSVELIDVSDAYSSTAFIGIAQEAGAAGDFISICVGGITLAKCDTTDPIFGSAVVEGAADGQVGALLIGSLDATTVEGTVFGVFLDVENSSDLAPIYLYGRG